MPEILMPALSPTMEEGKIAKWHVKVGDRVSSGDVIAEIETDKATMEVEAVDEGVVSKILVPEGTEGVKVNTAIATLAGDDEPKPKSNGNGTAAAAPAAAPKPTPAPASAKAESKAPAAAAPPAPLLTDPAIPAGTEMHSITVREALREAM